MSPNPDLSHSAASGLAPFATPHWSVVLAAGNPESPQATEALEKLCRAYWYPLYAFIRRQGSSPQDAQDLTQGFFAHLLQRDFLRNVASAKGRFRSFLLASLKNFLSDARDRTGALRRGGGRVIVSLDETSTEALYALEPADEVTPDKLFDRRWALTLLDQARERLEAEYVASGKRQLY